MWYHLYQVTRELKVVYSSRYIRVLARDGECIVVIVHVIASLTNLASLFVLPRKTRFLKVSSDVHSDRHAGGAVLRFVKHHTLVCRVVLMSPAFSLGYMVRIVYPKVRIIPPRAL